MEKRTLESELAHFGVKGMKWGVRRRRSAGSSGETGNARPTSVGDTTPRHVKGSTPVQIKIVPGKRIQTKGGAKQPPSQEAVVAAALKQLANKSGVQTLTNNEIRILVDRIGLEKRLAEVNPRPKSLGKKFAQDILPGAAVQAGIKMTLGQLTEKHDPRIAKGLKFTDQLLTVLAASQGKKRAPIPEPKKDNEKKKKDKD